jgi:NADPH2:quinone reductase
METMKAYVLYEYGGRDKLCLTEIARPKPKDGWVLVEIMAFGINRAEWFTREGHSPDVKRPRVIGIECVGVISASFNPSLPPGQKVAAMMGGMGRDFDGSYAQFALVPEECVIPFESKLDWSILGGLPEMLQTAHGSLYQSLEIDRANHQTDTLLIRGGTSSIGLCALAIARAAGMRVLTTTRSPDKADRLTQLGAHHVLTDDGQLAQKVRSLEIGGVSRVLELVGTSSLRDSLRCVQPQGIVCMTGILGGAWELAQFSPMYDIPSSVKLTSYAGDAADLPASVFQNYIDRIESGEFVLPESEVFSFDNLPMAHRKMDENTTKGKMVVLV